MDDQLTISHWLQIFSFVCDARSLGRISCVCTKWNVAANVPVLWSAAYSARVESLSRNARVVDAVPALREAIPRKRHASRELRRDGAVAAELFPPSPVHKRASSQLWSDEFELSIEGEARQQPVRDWRRAYFETIVALTGRLAGDHVQVIRSSRGATPRPAWPFKGACRITRYTSMTAAAAASSGSSSSREYGAPIPPPRSASRPDAVWQHPLHAPTPAAAAPAASSHRAAAGKQAPGGLLSDFMTFFKAPPATTAAVAAAPARAAAAASSAATAALSTLSAMWNDAVAATAAPHESDDVPFSPLPLARLATDAVARATSVFASPRTEAGFDMSLCILAWREADVVALLSDVNVSGRASIRARSVTRCATYWEAFERLPMPSPSSAGMLDFSDEHVRCNITAVALDAPMDAATFMLSSIAARFDAFLIYVSSAVDAADGNAASTCMASAWKALAAARYDGTQPICVLAGDQCTEAAPGASMTLSPMLMSWLWRRSIALHAPARIASPEVTWLLAGALTEHKGRQTALHSGIRWLARSVSTGSERTVPDEPVDVHSVSLDEFVSQTAAGDAAAAPVVNGERRLPAQVVRLSFADMHAACSPLVNE